MNHGDRRLTQNFLWNTAGSIFFLVCQWIITVLVVRLSDGFSDAGLLSLAMSVTNVFAIIALFNVRNYQVSDSEELYSAGEYVSHRFVTCALAFVLCAVTTFLGGYGIYTAACILAYMLLKLTENFVDVFHGIVQKKWRLDIAGRSFLFRGILTVASFAVVFGLFHNLLLAILAMALTNLLSLLIYDWNAVRRVERVRLSFSPNRLLSLSKVCLPMVGYGFCIHSILPLVKAVLEAHHGEEMLGYYGSVTTVATLIQSFTLLVFTPLIGVFDEAFRAGDRKKLKRLFARLILLIVAITLLAMGAIALLGDFAMSLVFGEEILPYVYLLYPTVVASALTALVWLLGMILVVMRSMKTLLIGAVIGLAVGIAASVTLIPTAAFSGANVAQILPFAVIAAIYLTRFVIYVFHSPVPKDGEDVPNKKEN
ncbi:MAG: lipopolysaccharide biosynthesis protein [Clostridia bacterium]|nr:lipopolysaccharide biosynthesis protein [Clostridia bacterium]